MKKPEKATTTPNNSKLKLLTILAAMLVLLWGIDQLGTNQNTPTGYQTSETADLQIRGTPTYDKETGKLTIEVKNAGENLVDKFYVTVDVLEENTDKQVIGTIGIVITWSDRENAIESGETRVIEYLLDSQTPSIKENSKSRNLVLRVGVASGTDVQDGEVIRITIKSDTTPTTQTAATSTPTTIKTGQSANALIPAYNLKGGIEKEVILIKESSPALDVDFIMAHKNNCKIKDEGYYYYNVINAPRERIYIIKPEEDCQFHPEARIEDLPKADLTAKNLKKGDIYFFAVLPETTGKSVKEWMPECKIKDSSAANKLQTSDIGTAFTFSVEEDCTTELKGETKTTTQTAITSTPATTKAGTTTTNIPGFNLKEGQHLVAVTPNMIGATKKDLLKGGRLAGNCIIQKVGGLPSAGTITEDQLGDYIQVIIENHIIGDAHCKFNPSETKTEKETPTPIRLQAKNSDGSYYENRIGITRHILTLGLNEGYSNEIETLYGCRIKEAAIYGTTVTGKTIPVEERSFSENDLGRVARIKVENDCTLFEQAKEKREKLPDLGIYDASYDKETGKLTIEVKNVGEAAADFSGEQKLAANVKVTRKAVEVGKQITVASELVSFINEPTIQPSETRKIETTLTSAGAIKENSDVNLVLEVKIGAKKGLKDDGTFTIEKEKTHDNNAREITVYKSFTGGRCQEGADNGIDYFKKATTMMVDRATNEHLQEAPDACEDSYTLREYACDTTGTKIISGTKQCQDGCSEGACVRVEEKEIDYSIPGFVLESGWNLIGITDDMEYKTTNDIKGDCNIKYAFVYDDEAQARLMSTPTRTARIAPALIGNAMWVYTANKCRYNPEATPEMVMNSRVQEALESGQTATTTVTQDMQGRKIQDIKIRGCNIEKAWAYLPSGVSEQREEEESYVGWLRLLPNDMLREGYLGKGMVIQAGQECTKQETEDSTGGTQEGTGGTTGCTETDDGRERNKKGTIKINGEELQSDSCREGKLIELYCKGNELKAEQPYTCPYGCSEGACTILGYELKAGTQLVDVDKSIIERFGLSKLFTAINANLDADVNEWQGSCKGKTTGFKVIGLNDVGTVRFEVTASEACTLMDKGTVKAVNLNYKLTAGTQLVAVKKEHVDKVGISNVFTDAKWLGSCNKGKVLAQPVKGVSSATVFKVSATEACTLADGGTVSKHNPQDYPLPDLTVEITKAPATLLQGEDYANNDYRGRKDIVVTITNKGTAEVTAGNYDDTLSFYSVLYLTKDGKVIERIAGNSINPLLTPLEKDGKTSTELSFSWKVPADLQSGKYKLTAIADTQQKITEKNENNNMAEKEVCVGSCTTAAPTTGTGSGTTITGNRIFVTSEIFPTGDLQGLAGADSKCTSLAKTAGLTGTWKAWLSTSTTNAKDRIPDKKYTNMKGQTIAENKADLTDGTLTNPIQYNEKGETATDRPILTGTQLTGEKSSANCNDWNIEDKTNEQTTQTDALLGNAYTTSSSWTAFANEPCNYAHAASKPFRIYCFETG